MTSPNLAREGNCLCGAPVSLHFDRNRKLACEVALRRFQQHQLETADALPQESLRDADVQRGPRHSFFERRIHPLFM